MNKEIVEQIQNRIIELLPKDKQIPIGGLLNDSCSEVSRLAAGWIMESDNTSQLIILRGTNVRGTHKSHDILAVQSLENEVYIIDPTIWQLFPKKQSILLFLAKNLNESLIEVEKIYGGKWDISEQINQVTPADQKNYLDIINKNIRENLKQ